MPIDQLLSDLKNEFFRRHDLTLGIQMHSRMFNCESYDVGTLSAKDVRRICDAVAAMPRNNISSLYWCDVGVDNDGATILAEMLENNKNVRYLTLSENEIGNNGAKAIAEMLRKNTTIEHLDLSGNNIGDSGAKAIEQALEDNSTVQSINLDANNNSWGWAISEQTKNNIRVLLHNKNRMERFCAHLKKTNPENISLEDQQIEKEGAFVLAEFLGKVKNVSTLNMSGNALENEGVTAIVRSLHMNDKIKNLKLSQNRILDMGAKSIADMLKVNNVVCSIDLSLNAIGDEGVKEISEALKINQTVEEINLSDNEIGYDGAKALAEMIKINKVIRIINIRRNKIGPNGTYKLLNAIRVNNTLNEFHFDIANGSIVTPIVFGNMSYKDRIEYKNSPFIREEIAFFDKEYENDQQNDFEKLIEKIKNNLCCSYYELETNSVNSDLILSFIEEEKLDAEEIENFIHDSGIIDYIENNVDFIDESIVPLIVSPAISVQDEVQDQEDTFLGKGEAFFENEDENDQKNPSEALTEKTEKPFIASEDAFEENSIDDEKMHSANAAEKVAAEKNEIDVFDEKSGDDFSDNQNTNQDSSHFPITSPVIASFSAVAMRLKQQQSSGSNQELAEHLMQYVDSDAEKLAKQTFDYYAILKELKKDAIHQERQLQKQQMELERLRALLNSGTCAGQEDLEARIKSLEKNQQVLMHDREIKLADLAQKEIILNHKSMARFYRTIQNKLQQMFLAYKVIGSGLVMNKELTTTDKVISYINLASESIPLPGSRVVATWLGYAIKAGIWLASNKNESDNDQKITDINEITVSFQEIDALTEATALKLTLTYAEQLHEVLPECAGVLAEAAVKLMIAYLWSGDYKKEPLDKQLVSSVASVSQTNERKTYFQSAVATIKELSGKINDTPIATIQYGRGWTAFAIFQKPGIEVIDVQTNQRRYYHGCETLPGMFGYRLGGDDEAKLAGLTLSINRVGATGMTPSNARQLREATFKAISAQRDVEVLTKQVAYLTSLMSVQPTNHSSSTMQGMHRSFVTSSSRSESIHSGIYIHDNTLSLSIRDIPWQKHEDVKFLMTHFAECCDKSNIVRNTNDDIIAMTFPVPQHVDILRLALLELLGLPDPKQAPTRK